MCFLFVYFSFLFPLNFGFVGKNESIALAFSMEGAVGVLSFMRVYICNVANEEAK